VSDLPDGANLFVGGEFYYDDRFTLDQPVTPQEDALFLNGGKACLMLICDFLRDHGTRHLLLPDYLCPTILDTLDTCGLSYDFYVINSDFSVNTHSLTQQLKENQAIYFINYFGFQPDRTVRAFLQDLQLNGLYLIEDNAQAGFASRSIGDFVFNSMRKLCPYDGGYLKTSQNLRPYLQAYQGRKNRRLPLIRQYRVGLREYLFSDRGDYEALDALYARAEAVYANDTVVLGDEGEHQQIERLDWPAIKQARRKNYLALLKSIAENQLITPIFPRLQRDNMPLGLPVYVRDGLRDALNEYLGEHDIGLTIHWEGIETDPRLQSRTRAKKMASSILTLTIDQYTNADQLQYLAKKLIDFEKLSPSF